MDKGLVDLAKLRKNIRNADFEGKSSFSFILANKLIKIYARKIDKGLFIPPNVNKIIDFSNYRADTIVFPDEYIYENGKKAGEISQYINSKRLDEAIDDSVNIKTMINSYEQVINDLYLYNFINMIDLCYVNILYSNTNGFHIIDSTDWKIEEHALNKNIYYLNTSVENTIIEYLEIPYDYCNQCYRVDTSFLNNLDKYGFFGKALKKSLILINKDKYNFIKFMFSYLDVYRIHYGSEAETLKDVKELTKVLKKG